MSQTPSVAIRGDCPRATKREIESGAERPEALPVNPQGIPESLRSLPQWVAWKYSRPNDRRKWTKVPVDAKTKNGKLASTTDPPTWATFDEAADYHRSRPEKCDGIGFVFAKGGGLVGVDLDDAIDPESGEIKTWAIEIVEELDTYTEVSPSGTGLKAWLAGSLPEELDRHNKEIEDGKIELYQDGRYFCMTGQQLEMSSPLVEPRGRELETICNRIFKAKPKPKPKPKPTQKPSQPTSLDDEELLRLAMNAKDGAEFKALWDGDISAYGDDDSRADFALCRKLAFWTAGDSARMDRLFRWSGLLREKWDAPRREGTYGQMTIENAISATPDHYSGRGGGNAAPKGDGEPAKGQLLRNFRIVEEDEKELKIGLSHNTIWTRLSAFTDDWPRRVGSQLFVADDDHQIRWLENEKDLFAWVGRLMGGGEDCPIQWISQGSDKVSKGEFFAFLRQTVTSYKAVESYPHWPPLEGHFYYHPPLQGGDGKAVRDFLGMLSPASEADGQLLKAMLLSLAWGGPFGQRPCFLLDADPDDRQRGRGVGKSKTAEKMSRLVGGAITMEKGEDFQKFKSRLLSPGAQAQRAIMLDNLKSLKLSDASIEAAITAHTISGHRMYHGEGSRPNSFQWIMTVNHASLSKDLSQRCIVVYIKRPKGSAQWEREIDAFLEERRWELLGDLVSQLQSTPPKLDTVSRWSCWEAEVLAHCDSPKDLQSLIAQRQEGVDEDEEEAELVRGAIQKEIEQRGHCARTGAYWIPTSLLLRVINLALEETFSARRLSPYLKTLCIRELKKSDRGYARGWAWRGGDSDPAAQCVPF